MLQPRTYWKIEPNSCQNSGTEMLSPKAAGGSASSQPGPAEVDILINTYRMHMTKGSNIRRSHISEVLNQLQQVNHNTQCSLATRATVSKNSTGRSLYSLSSYEYLVFTKCYGNSNKKKPTAILHKTTKNLPSGNG